MVPKWIRSGNLLLWGTVICSFFGMAGNQSQDPPNVQVKGIRGESVSFAVNVTSTKPWSKIKWFYETKEEGKLMIANISDGELKRTNPDDRFGPRLEMVNQTTLRIADLKTEDSGIYMAEVRFDTAETQTHLFALAVDGVDDNQPQDPPLVQLNRTLGQSVLIILNLPPGKNISEIKWDYKSQGKKIMIAINANGEVNLTEPSNRFGQRLEMVNQTTLGIADLKMEDSGIYMAEVRFSTFETQTHRFALAVNDKREVAWYMCLFLPYCFSPTYLIIISCLLVFVTIFCICLCRREKMKQSIREGCVAWCPRLLDQKEKEKTPMQFEGDIQEASSEPSPTTN